jgi:hypothetical protein
MATKNVLTTNFFSPLSFVFLDPGSEMGKNQDPQHCFPIISFRFSWLPGSSPHQVIYRNQCFGSGMIFFGSVSGSYLSVGLDLDPDPVSDPSWIFSNIVNINFIFVFPFCKCVRIEIMTRNKLFSRVSDPDWIRIPSDHWIRIRIRNLNTDPDPDPGGQK